MKNIIFFSKSLNIGGMEKALVSLINNLCNKYNVTLVLENKHGVLLDTVNRKVNIKEYKVSNSKFKIYRKIYNFTKRSLWKLFNYNKYDFSCCYATYSIIGSRLALIASKNSSLYVHSDYYNYFKGDFKKTQEFFSLLKTEKFKHIIFVSNESKNNVSYILKKDSEKFVVINNIIDYKGIIKQSQKKFNNIYNKQEINILFVGRLDNDSKNIDLLIDSFNIVYKEKQNIKLYIIGNGPYINDLLVKIKKLKLNNVKLLGEKSNPYPYMKYCDAIVLTSRYEGFPVIYNEALVLNKKVITTIPVSDQDLNIKELFTIVAPKAKDIANAILKIKKEPIKYEINIENLNEKRLSYLTKIINKGGSKNEI